MSYGRPPPRIDGMVSLKVDNLTYRTTPEDLRRVFERCGEVGDIYIPRDRFSRESRGFAFVRFYDKRDAEDALDAMDGRILDGRELRVQMARYGRPSSPYRRHSRRRSIMYLVLIYFDLPAALDLALAVVHLDPGAAHVPGAAVARTPGHALVLGLVGALVPGHVLTARALVEDLHPEAGVQEIEAGASPDLNQSEKSKEIARVGSTFVLNGVASCELFYSDQNSLFFYIPSNRRIVSAIQ
ncbi:Splicing factor, arginine/serine-rich 2, partial [Gryllus bimaculatus]